MEPMIGILQLGIWIIVAIMIALVALYAYLMYVLPNKTDFTGKFTRDEENHKQMGYENYSFNTEDDGINSNYNTEDDGLNGDYNNEDDGPIQHL